MFDSLKEKYQSKLAALQLVLGAKKKELDSARVAFFVAKAAPEGDNDARQKEARKNLDRAYESYLLVHGRIQQTKEFLDEEADQEFLEDVVSNLSRSSILDAGATGYAG